jgi:hypothetical protein
MTANNTHPMVEKCARAMFALDYPFNSDGWDHAGIGLRGSYVDAVLAVLRILREPDDPTLDRADFHSAAHSVSGETYPVARNFIRAYIDSILPQEKAEP